MIAWILEELEKNPTSVFRKRDLRKISEQQFAELKRLGFLSYVQPDLNSDTYPCSLPCENACPMDIVEEEGSLFAICPKDSELDPIPLDRPDLDKYAFCVEKFLERVRTANDLSGTLHAVDEDYLYVGQTTRNGRRVAFVFGLAVAHKSVLELVGLKRLCSDDCYLVVLSPASAIEDIAVVRQLSQDRIIQTSLTILLDFQTYKLSDQLILSPITTTPLLSIDKQRMEAFYDGVPHSITERQADFLEKLLENPGVWIGGSELKSNYHERLDKVKNSLPEPILKLIESHTRKGYRLRESD